MTIKLYDGVKHSMTLEIKKPDDVKDLDTYQREASRTSQAHGDLDTLVSVLGLVGETGEVVEHLKKVVGHGHALDVDKLKEELGDVLGYVADLATKFNIPLSTIARHNVDKLRRRYPDGFDAERSKGRSS